MTIPMIASDEIMAQKTQEAEKIEETQETESKEAPKCEEYTEFDACSHELPRGQTGVERPLSIEQRPETCKDDWKK